MTNLSISLVWVGIPTESVETTSMTSSETTTTVSSEESSMESSTTTNVISSEESETTTEEETTSVEVEITSVPSCQINLQVCRDTPCSCRGKTVFQPKTSARVRITEDVTFDVNFETENSVEMTGVTASFENSRSSFCFVYFFSDFKLI